MDYYVVVEEDNSRPYAHYLYRIRWDLDRISTDFGRDGYIVQRVSFCNDTGIDIKVSFEGDYYEAWKVINGKMEYEEAGYDDEFSSGYPIELEGFEEGCREDSIGKKGNIQYNCSVFWVDKGSNEYKEIMKWKKGAVGNAARDLPSISAKECKLVFKRLIQERHFTHNVNYMNEE